MPLPSLSCQQQGVQNWGSHPGCPAKELLSRLPQAEGLMGRIKSYTYLLQSLQIPINHINKNACNSKSDYGRRGWAKNLDTPMPVYSKSNPKLLF